MTAINLPLSKACIELWHFHIIDNM